MSLINSLLESNSGGFSASQPMWANLNIEVNNIDESEVRDAISEVLSEKASRSLDWVFSVFLADPKRSITQRLGRKVHTTGGPLEVVVKEWPGLTAVFRDRWGVRDEKDGYYVEVWVKLDVELKLAFAS